jgi:hypothetical protein
MNLLIFVLIAVCSGFEFTRYTENIKRNPNVIRSVNHRTNSLSQDELDEMLFGGPKQNLPTRVTLTDLPPDVQTKYCSIKFYKNMTIAGTCEEEFCVKNPNLKAHNSICYAEFHSYQRQNRNCVFQKQFRMFDTGICKSFGNVITLCIGKNHVAENIKECNK